jgi:DNA-binding MarR family transcriptional regulator
MALPPTNQIQPNLRRFELARQQLIAQVCRRHEVNRTEFDALDELSHADGLTPGDLGERLSLTSGSVTALLDRLERLGWAERSRHPDDRRKILVRGTPKAVTVGAAEIGPMVAALNEIASRLPARDQRTIDRFLQEAADAVLAIVDERRQTSDGRARSAVGGRSQNPG